MSKNDDPTLASLLGSSFALVQHGLDRAIEWGFGKIKESSEHIPEASKATSEPLKKAQRFGRGALKFIGNAGEAYFKTYEDLKKKKR